jgi:hypothetical protein
MSAASPFHYCRFSGHPDGFGEDASFFFRRAGTGAARWHGQLRPRPTPARGPSPLPSHRARRFGLALVVLGVLLCILVVLEGVRVHLHRARQNGWTEAESHRRLVSPIPAKRQCLVVPVSAVRHDESGPYVVVVDADHIAHLRKVKVGSETEQEIEILDGLDSRESILARFPLDIREGDRVDVP